VTETGSTLVETSPSRWQAVRRLCPPFVWHTLLYSGSAAALKLAGFGVVLWLARRVSLADYGTWGLLYALQTGVALFGPVGIVEAVIGLLRTRRDPAAQQSLYAAANLVFCGNVAVATLLGGVLYFVVLRGREAAVPFPTFGLVLASGILTAYATLLAQVVRLQERHAASLAFNFVVPAAGLLGSALAFALRGNVSSYFLGGTLGLAAGLLAARAVGSVAGGIRGGGAEWRLIVVRIGPFFAVTALGWVSGYGNTYVIKLCFDATVLAKFTLAFMLSGVLQLVASAMNQVWSPRFYRIVHDTPAAEVERQSRRFFLWQGVAMGAAGGLLILGFPFVARLIGGNLLHYGTMAPELFMLVVAYVAIVPFWHCQNYLLAFDQGAAMMNIHLVSSALGLAALVGLIYVAGPFGIYLGFLVQMVLRSGAAVWVARRRWPAHVPWQGVLAGIALAGLGALGAGWAASVSSHLAPLGTLTP
jgi:O-antigen/teichoic acid export membrane protein